MKRPGPLRWLRYAAGAGLPPEYSTWVLHDTTTSTWVLRHLARVLVLIAVPLAGLLSVIPAGLGLRALTAFVTGACVLLLTSILSNEMTERRVHKAGYPWGTAESTRAHRAVEEQRRANRRRRERSAARRLDRSR